jgi:hypothetical protein
MGSFATTTQQEFLISISDQKLVVITHSLPSPSILFRPMPILSAEASAVPHETFRLQRKKEKKNKHHPICHQRKKVNKGYL